MADLLAVGREHHVAKREMRRRRYLACGSGEDIDLIRGQNDEKPVSLIVTSPPYPGVHVLYHRWQVDGRKETAAPYWIASRRDGFGESFYTLGGRSVSGVGAYFERLREVYDTLRRSLAENAAVVQLVAFNDATAQLPLFLKAMAKAGYTEARGPRLTRTVPNRRWYSRGKRHDASNEYVVVHRRR